VCHDECAGEKSRVRRVNGPRVRLASCENAWVVYGEVAKLSRWTYTAWSDMMKSFVLLGLKLWWSEEDGGFLYSTSRGSEVKKRIQR
jgi:hypothetical protein